MTEKFVESKFFEYWDKTNDPRRAYEMTKYFIFEKKRSEYLRLSKETKISIQMKLYELKLKYM